MAIQRKSLKTSLEGKDLQYTNDFFNFKNETIITSDSFSYNAYNALQNVNDAKTNNLSNLFLTKKQLNSDWLEVNEKKEDNIDLVTTLSFYAKDNTDSTNPGVWLYFDKTYEFWDVYLKDAPYALTSGRPDKDIYNYFFYLQFLDDTRCKISHNFGDLIFYLGVNEDLTIQFYTRDDDETTVFNYAYTDGVLKLYKTITIEDEDGNVSTAVYNLVCQQSESGGYALGLVTSPENISDSIIYVNEGVLKMGVYLDNSYVAYDQSQYITAIDRNRSAFHLPSQVLLHHQYNKEGGMNFVPLKNNANYQGGHSRGSNLTDSPEDYPDVNYRQYNSIHSGINQEYGNNDIILNYHFTDQTYTLTDGASFTFDIPSIEENGGKEPLWPYKTINIADTKFIKNGAFASNVPFFADKFYKLQGPNSRLVNEEGESVSPNNGTYLCTWLWQSNDKSEVFWLDRYYYPDKVNRAEVLKGNARFEQSFENIIDKNYDTEEINKVIKENTYFDKLSDVVIEPDNSYKYSRLSSTMVDEVNETINKSRITEVENQYGEFTYLSDQLIPDNKNWLRIDHSLFNKTNKFNFNTDIYITPEKRIGIQLFGSDYKAGFNIQNRKDLSPFHYYATEKEIYMLNNQFEIKRKFDLFSKYKDSISKFILGNVFDDIIVVSNRYLYIFAYDLRLKTRIQYEDILDLQNLELNGINGSLLNYPYGDNFVEFGEYIEPEGVDLGFEWEDLYEELGTIRYDDSILLNAEIPELNLFFETKIAEIISNEHAIIYNNNLYIPYNQDILKIIFVPDSPYDNFTKEQMEEYPCKARILGPYEYYLNFARGAEGEETDEPGIENGFIEVENKIKNIYFNNEGKLFAFNFDQMAMSSDGNTMYGLYAWDKYINAGGWYWLYNQPLSKIQAIVSSSKFAEFGSNESIDWIQMNERGEMLLVRGFSSAQSIEVDENAKRFEIYDKTKKRIYQYFLNGYEKVYSVDAYNYIDEYNQEHSAFTILALKGNNVYKIEYQSESKHVELSLTELPVDCNPRFSETTNSNSIIRYANENKLYFNLYLPTGYLYDYHEQIVWDISEIQQGWYNVNVHIDLDKAEFIIKINDIEYDYRIQTDTFEPYVFSNGTIFDTTYYVANVGKKYGTTMDRILSETRNDPYVCKNVKFNNMRIYNKALEYYEYQAMRLDGKGINPITLTIPCGQRSNIEEIVRYFRYTPPSAISNKVKINISGTGLSTKGEFQLLEKEIRTVLENNMDCLVDVEQIDFI